MHVITLSLLFLLNAPPSTQPRTVEPAPILPGRPDAATPAGAMDANVLGPAFESLTSGITFRSPAGFAELRNVNGAGDEIVSYTSDAKRAVLKVNRLAFNESIAMTYHKKEADKLDSPDVNGLFEETMGRLKADAPNIEIKKAEIEPRGNLDIGTIIGRYNVGTETNLAMIALLRQRPAPGAPDGAYVYYSFSFTYALPKDVNLDADPAVAQAYQMFNAVVDSVRLLDQTELREDQNDRLYRTRTLFVNLTEARLKSTLSHEQWLRLIRDGKDIGYSYVVEETGRDLPRAGRMGSQQVGGQEGVLIGVRTRTSPDSGVRVEAESWMWNSFDRKHEKWSTAAIITDPKSGKDGVGEVGSSDSEVRIVRDDDILAPGEKIKSKTGKIEEDKSQPQVRQREVTTLHVTNVGKEKSGQPIFRQLPPWYLPQAISHLLPRLLARQQGKTYLFATYNSDAREVMMRYVDVGEEQTVQLAGQTFRAIPISDRLGLEGSKTMHYVSFDGKYLGSYNADQKITILPTDSVTLEKMWKDANLTRPGAVDEKK